ncbi:hypothetical protein THRCLA_05144 [Thraustotheca clavata]|uniref:Transmembrane protein n=1 Tax=Thraustotheca clavata TaxID=74557 RepID=A0A1V9ZWT3_9STRA|nr:hypothetical protein THRCLA_05144 [Thraustotheca clavata]
MNLRCAKVGDERYTSMRTVPKYTVHHDGLAMIVSMCMLLNIAAMPMKAYLSENLPWNKYLTPEVDTSNYKDFNSTTLQLQQNTYNKKTLPNESTYYTDEVVDVQVLRHYINLTYNEPISRDDCTQNFVLGMPGLIYYTPKQIDLICNVSASANATTYIQSYSGDCFYDKFFSIDIGYSCLWIEKISGSNDSSSFDIFAVIYTFSPTRYDKWLWCKFSYRILLTVFVLYQMWTNYYKHILALTQLLKTLGHRFNLGKQTWHYELIIGDPTAIILMDHWIALAFVVDIWISTNNVGIAVLRATQNGDLTVMFLTFLYLSRTVWFAYCALCLVAYILKKYHKENIFTQVDPTLVAIAVAIYGPLVSWLSGNIALFAQLYQWMFTCFVPSNLVGQQNELAFGCTVYTSLIACIPLLFGFTASFFERNTTTKRKIIDHNMRVKHQDYSSISYNNFKNRLVFGLSCWLNQDDALTVRGGAIYKLFAKNPQYRSCPTFSTRAADCFLMCYYKGQLKEKLRLSLRSSLSLNTNNPTLAIKVSKIPAMYRFNELIECIDGTGNIELHQPVERSMWCI